MQGYFRSLYFYRELNSGSEYTSEAQVSGFLVKEWGGLCVGEGQGARGGLQDGPGNLGKNSLEFCVFPFCTPTSPRLESTSLSRLIVPRVFMFDFLGCHSDHINGLCGLSWLFSLPVLLERPVTFTGSEAVSEICSPSDCHRTISSSSTKPLNCFSKARCGSGGARGSQDCCVGPGPDCHPQRVAGGRGLEGPRGTIWWHSPAEAWPESSVRQSPWEGGRC